MEVTIIIPPITPNLPNIYGDMGKEALVLLSDNLYDEIKGRIYRDKINPEEVYYYHPGIGDYRQTTKVIGLEERNAGDPPRTISFLTKEGTMQISLKNAFRISDVLP